MKKSGGFTLIEALVAVTIVALSVAGPMYAANRALIVSQNSRNQLTASYLAQEGIETIRLLRDDEYVGQYPNTATSWTDFVTYVTTTKNCDVACTVDYVPGTGPVVNDCASPASCNSLRRNTTTGIYSVGAGSSTIFKRYVQVLDVTPASATEKRVVSTVEWNFHGTKHSVTISDHLTSWQ